MCWWHVYSCLLSIFKIVLLLLFWLMAIDAFAVQNVKHLTVWENVGTIRTKRGLWTWAVLRIRTREGVRERLTEEPCESADALNDVSCRVSPRSLTLHTAPFVWSKAQILLTRTLGFLETQWSLEKAGTCWPPGHLLIAHLLALRGAGAGGFISALFMEAFSVRSKHRIRLIKSRSC